MTLKNWLICILIENLHYFLFRNESHSICNLKFIELKIGLCVQTPILWLEFRYWNSQKLLLISKVSISTVYQEIFALFNFRRIVILRCSWILFWVLGWMMVNWNILKWNIGESLIFTSFYSSKCMWKIFQFIVFDI